MPLNTKPLNNNVLIEIEREFEDVSRSDENETLSQGKLIDWSVSGFHLTASAGVEFDEVFLEEQTSRLKTMKGKTVRWEEFAEGGQTFEEDGKKYALIPWWRLISVTDSK